MDPNETLLIDENGVETKHPIGEHCRPGLPVPSVVILNGKPSKGIPSKVFRFDPDEIERRDCHYPIYREVDALFI